MKPSVSDPAATKPAKRRPSLSWSLALSALAVVVWIGSQRVSTGPATGESLSGTAAVQSWSKSRSIRLGTFNIHSGRGADKRLDLARIAEAMQGADLVGLNEVRNEFPSDQANQAERLATILQHRWLFAPTEQRWWGQLFGNGIVTRLQVDDWQRLPLVRQTSKTFRNAILLELPTADQRIHVLVTHLDRTSATDRAAQFKSVAHWFLALDPPAVLLGDLNLTRDDPAIQQLLAEPDVIDALDQIANPPPRRIDWILLRGLKVQAAGLVDRGASDHPFYWADVQVP